ncbi:unnamed protein product [Rotaria sp. Silwood1]|nr:unnamed protein product [Rotaria sp. Silwood1]CAF1364592.1 unnamed protein product [Rotaria sp. Silwood1]CAF1365513.1 unnamed protein product [Rotaria sp. Silwood1]CAF3525249.1 unnamed protein product [Rotaria sp. Silwood1]CAF3544509.1 unnamed protein product [Rotaria sp. Silwood1]
MIESNITLSHQTHQILILSSKSTIDYTSIYVIVLLIILLFILIFYLMYNFISYKRYSISRKNQRNSSLHSIEQLNDHLSIVLTQSTKPKVERRSQSFGELQIPLNRVPLRATSLSMYSKFREKKNFISNQYEITNQLVSDL